MRAAIPLLALIGCVPATEEPLPGTDTAVGTEPVACTELGPTITIGTGDVAFVPLAEGDEVVMVHGPQGGWHVDVAARIGNTHQTIAFRPSITLDATGEAVASEPQDAYVALAGFTECDGEVWGQRCYIDEHEPTDQAFVCSLAGESATIVVRVTDPQTGLSASAEQRVTLAADPTDDCP